MTVSHAITMHAGGDAVASAPDERVRFAESFKAVCDQFYHHNDALARAVLHAFEICEGVNGDGKVLIVVEHPCVRSLSHTLEV